MTHAEKYVLPPPTQKKKKNKVAKNAKVTFQSDTEGRFQPMTFRTGGIYFLQIQIVTICTNLLPSPQNFDSLEKLS